MITVNPSKTTYMERSIISVFHKFNEAIDDIPILYPFMTVRMDLEEYNQLNVKMPEFLIGQEFEILTESWQEECECDEAYGEHDWDKNTCTDVEPTTAICGSFIFHFMPHEFFVFAFYKGIP